MTTSPLEPLIFSLAVPSIAIMVVSALYNMADTFFVSSLGTSVVGAVGVAFPLMAVIQAIGFFFGQGAGNYISRALGARDTQRAYRMAATSFISGTAFMALIAAGCIVFRNPLVSALGATKTIAPYALDYVLFILLSAPWMVAATILNQQLRFQGSASIAMIGMISGAVLNIGLDPLFIFVFNMGITGAALATMLSQITSFAILFCYACTRQGNIPIRIRDFAPSRELYDGMFKGGVPSLIRQGLVSLTAIIINHMAATYGDAAIAAIAIVNRLYLFCNTLILGFGQGFQPVCGFNYGAKLYKRVKQGFWFCVRTVFCALFVMTVLMLVFAPEVIAFFRRGDPEVISIGSLGLRLRCILLPLSAFVVMNTMMTQTMGMAFYSSLITTSRQGLFLLPLLFIFNKLTNLGILGILVCFPISDAMSFLMTIPLSIQVLRSMNTLSEHNFNAEQDGLQDYSH